MKQRSGRRLTKDTRRERKGADNSGRKDSSNKVARAKAEHVPLRHTFNTFSQWFDEHTLQAVWSWQEELGDDPERLRELQQAIDHARDVMPLEKVTMLSRTMLNRLQNRRGRSFGRP